MASGIEQHLASTTTFIPLESQILEGGLLTLCDEMAVRAYHPD